MEVSRFKRLLRIFFRRTIARDCKAVARQEQSQTTTPLPAFLIAGFFWFLLGAPTLLMFSALLLPDDSNSVSDMAALSAQCTQYEENPWVQAVGWEAPLRDMNQCPDLASSMEQFSDAFGEQCFDTYFTSRVEPLVKFIENPESEDAQGGFFQSLYYWPSAISFGAVGMDSTLKLLRCSLIAGAEAAPVSQPTRDGLQRSVRAGFGLYATRALNRRILRGALVAGPWSGLQTTALLSTTGKRNETIVSAINEIDRIQLDEIMLLTNEVNSMLDQGCDAQLAELKLLLLTEKLSAYLEELRADYVFTRNSFRCHEAWADPNEEYSAERAGELYQDLAQSYAKQCQISAMLADSWQLYHGELQTLKGRQSTTRESKEFYQRLMVEYKKSGDLQRTLETAGVLDDLADQGCAFS